MLGFLLQRSKTLHHEYDGDVAAALARRPEQPFIVTNADLAPLPRPIQRYLRIAGVVGQPRVQNFHVRMHGRLRGRPDARWMPLEAEQFSTVDPPERLFYMKSSLLGVPVRGYHRYEGASASMRVKAAGLLTVAESQGPLMHQAETVTFFNDLCVLAPGALIDPAIVWLPVSGTCVRAQFSNAGHTIRAELLFNADGELIDFVSDDRLQAAGGSEMRQMRWSTPLRGYRSFGRVRLASMGEARWHEPTGPYTYIELTIDEIAYNVVAASLRPSTYL